MLATIYTYSSDLNLHLICLLRLSHFTVFIIPSFQTVGMERHQTQPAEKPGVLCYIGQVSFRIEGLMAPDMTTHVFALVVGPSKSWNSVKWLLFLIYIIFLNSCVDMCMP